MCAPPCTCAERIAARIYAEAAANVAAGISTARTTYAELDVDAETRLRPGLSRGAAKRQRREPRPEWMDDPFITEDRPDLFDERSA